MKYKMEEKIDFVVTFVDKTDEYYIKKYNDFIKSHEIPIPEINNIEIRANDYGTLKCLFRSLDLYMPWINNVFLVVQSESQVPKWINRDAVKVVLHEEFIPKEFLPTYNTFTIQTHLHLIPGLSEKFISSDDDSILLTKSLPEHFFIKDKVVQVVKKIDNSRIKGSSSKASHYFKMYSCKTPKEIFEIEDDFYYQSDHSMHAMLKSLNSEMYNKLDVKKYITPFRQSGNIMRNSYFTYAFLKRKMIVLPSGKNAYIDFKNKTINNFRIWFNENCKRKQMSINDQDIKEGFDKKIFYKMITETIYKLFPNKSKKYEI